MRFDPRGERVGKLVLRLVGEELGGDGVGEGSALEGEDEVAALDRCVAVFLEGI